MINNLDFIGFRPQLYIESAERQKTKIGGLFTILLAILTVLAIVDFGKDILLKENPALYQNDVFNLENEIKFRNIPLVIGLMKSGGFTIAEVSRKLKVSLQYAITNSSNTEKILQNSSIIT